MYHRRDGRSSTTIFSHSLHFPCCISNFSREFIYNFILFILRSPTVFEPLAILYISKTRRAQPSCIHVAYVGRSRKDDKHLPLETASFAIYFSNIVPFYSYISRSLRLEWSLTSSQQQVGVLYTYICKHNWITSLRMKR